jgi:hypothetical protein
VGIELELQPLLGLLEGVDEGVKEEVMLAIDCADDMEDMVAVFGCDVGFRVSCVDVKILIVMSCVVSALLKQCYNEDGSLEVYMRFLP